MRHNCLISRESGNAYVTKRTKLLFGQNISQTYVNIAPSDPCWNCGSTEKGAHFFCKQCKALQKPNYNVNYFHLLGVDETFDINLGDLSKKFRQLQSVLHPDKFSNATDVSK